MSASNDSQNAQNDEQQLLASVGASRQQQDAYETQVIRDATHQLAPVLTGIGFPALHQIAPSYNNSNNNNLQYNPSDLPHVHSLLARVRRQLQQQRSCSNSEQENLLHFKEQILLQFLQSIAQLPSEELPVRRNQELAAEQQRSKAIQQKRDLDVKETKQRKKVTFSQDNVVAKKRARIPIMKRKREPRDDEQQDEDDIAKRKEELKQLRIERKKRKEERRKILLENSSSSEEEMEFDVETEQEDDEVQNGLDDEEEKMEAVLEAEAAAPVETTDATVTCPLCQNLIPTPDPSEVDSILSQHMDQCQRRRASRRSNRGANVEPSFSIDEEAKPPSRTKRKSNRVAAKKKNKKPKRVSPPVPRVIPGLDDLDERAYEDRVDDWIENGLSRMKDMKERDKDDVLPGEEEVQGGLYLPAWINDRLFGYQRTGLKWMWELHLQEAGGIVGDEMGLGKTVQVSSYLGALVASRKLKSVLIVAPATMLQHWLNELAIWAPGLRRVLIHPSGERDNLSRSVSTGLLQSLRKWLRQVRADRVNEPIDEEDWETMEPHSFCGTGYVIVTTYENVRRNADVYVQHQWSYVVLDEAQKIRNPDAHVTLACKRLRTPHRLALSGTPIQNDLRELWSLFDFVFPGRLGTLPTFEQEFADSIRRGGYSNASPMQVQLAYRCAVVLRDLINPYLLRRQKKDVKEVKLMPGKTEHVLFCRLSQRQRALYEAYLRSDQVSKVLTGGNQLFAAITMLRKISNHADLACDPDQASFESFVKKGYVNQADIDEDDESDFDDYDVADEESLVERSGKLEVLSKILPLWHKQGHRVLIFCQWKKMLNIIQRFIMVKGWKFGRLDGNTNVAARQRLVDAFNSDDSYFGMLCTSRTGGVGLNLTGANRVILYDPDWNPQTCAQARERAWRFGQEREVTVYRLITAGTVEEKMYQRQIFKTALSNKVLQDPRQRRLFSQRDLRDLFTLKPDSGSVRSGGDGLTETGQVTKGVGVLDPDQESAVGSTQDNEETIKSVMKSKGLAGIFDHNFVERDPTQKTTTVREMEEQAKKVAREAAGALRESVADQDRYEPERRFGSSTGSPAFSSAAFCQSSGNSSSALLASLRQRNGAVESGGMDDAPSDEGKQYAKLLSNIKDFVRRNRPTTDEILSEFDHVPSSDVAIFRKLLKSVASVDKGHWVLK